MVGKIKFQGVKSTRTFDAVPAGTYRSQFISYKTGVTGPASRTPGEDKVDLSFSVTGDVPGEEEFKNRRFFRTCTFGADALWAFKRTMVNLGSTVNWEDEDGVDIDAVCREVLNNYCIVKVSVEDTEIEVTRENILDHDGAAIGDKIPVQQNRVQDILPTDEMRLALQERAAPPLPTEVEYAGRRR